MSLDPKLPIKIEVTLEEVEGILAALGELPTKTNAFMLMAKLRGQAQTQIPQEEAPVEVPAEEPKAE